MYNEESIQEFIGKIVEVEYSDEQTLQTYSGLLMGIYHVMTTKEDWIYLKGAEYNEKGRFNIKVKSILSIKEIPPNEKGDS